MSHSQLEAVEQAGLPLPDQEAWNHSLELQAYIAAQISEAGGRIPFARFMESALYAPGLGYYSAGARKFGQAGDFVTAPEISSLFSRCLARQSAQVLARIETGQMLEFGAGTGKMAADILLELEALDSLPQRYSIIELSPDLRQRQLQTISEKAPHLIERVQWLTQMPKSGFKGVVVANEVLDAMPVNLIRFTEGAAEELYVGYDGERFTWESGSLSSTELESAVSALHAEMGESHFCRGYTTEVNLYMQGWLQSIAAMLEQGVFITLDYGFPRHEYYHPERTVGTLMCHYRHRAHADPLLLAGLQDLTAHVDFTAVAEAGHGAGMDVLGYTAQAQFLMGSGLLEIMQGQESDMRTQMELNQQIKKLTLPNEMGELFKAMVLGKGVDVPLIGFALQDRRGRL